MKKPIKYIELDYGMGDNIVCAGLLCCLARDNKVVIRIPPKQEKNRTTYETFFYGTGIKILNRDHSNVKIKMPVIAQGNAIVRAIKQGIPVTRFIFKQLTSAGTDSETPYPLRFFSNFKVPYSERFKYCPLRANSFYIKQWEAPQAPYIFMHEDPERGFVINRNKIKNWGKLQVVPCVFYNNVSILAYRNIIENAAEIHCIDSSLFHLVNSFKPKGKLFYHWYARPKSPQFLMHPEWKKIK